MFERFSHHLATVPDGGSWLFLGAPREEVFARVFAIIQGHLGVSAEAITVHPDVHVVRAPEEKTATGRQRVLSVEDIRDVLERLSLTALTGKKYLFLPDADWLSESAQNALLKMIEDPAGSLVACFFAEDISRIVAPLRSRLFLYRLAPLAQPVWQGSSENDPEIFLASSIRNRLSLIERLVKEGKGDVDLLLSWLMVLQRIAAERGEGKLFLASVTAWDDIRAQGNIHAAFTRMVFA